MLLVQYKLIFPAFIGRKHIPSIGLCYAFSQDQALIPGKIIIDIGWFIPEPGWLNIGSMTAGPDALY
jgi:hypothetical protein